MTGINGLAGRTVLVTGASRGIGRATAHACHSDGAHVIVHYSRSVESAETLAMELGDRVTLVHADLLDPDGPTRAWEAAVASRGRATYS